MTENEKAATFIGWKPFARSSWGEWGDEHGNPAPPMDDPSNYMKALESLEYAHPWKIEWHIDAGVHEFTFFMPDKNGDGTFLKYSSHKDRSIHTAHRSALAALYDAEHPTESR